MKEEEASNTGGSRSSAVDAQKAREFSGSVTQRVYVGIWDILGP